MFGIFCFECFTLLVSASDDSPVGACHEVALQDVLAALLIGTSQLLMGERFYVLVLVVLLGCDWKQEMQSCFSLLMSLVGIVL